MPFNRFRTARRPQRRHRARPGDEVDRRGDGLRRRLRHARSPRPRPRRSGRCRPAAGCSSSMANRDKRHDDLPDQGARRPRLRDPRHPGHRRGAAPQRRRGHRGAQALRGPGPERRADHRAADPGRRDRPGRSTPRTARPSGGSARIDGYEIRTAAVMANIPCITTVQGLGAAVQGIEAHARGDIGVRSLQDWAAAATGAVTAPYRRPVRPRA